VTKLFGFSAKAGNVAYCGNLEIPKPWSNIDLHRGRFRPSQPLELRHNAGGPLRDVVITGWAVPDVVSQKSSYRDLARRYATRMETSVGQNVGGALAY
jgi:hypothetical protein